jgi:hypothetical protein
MTAPSRERKAPVSCAKGPAVLRQTVCPSGSGEAAVGLHPERQSGRASREHLGLPLAAAFNFSEEMSNAFRAARAARRFQLGRVVLVGAADSGGPVRQYITRTIQREIRTQHTPRAGKDRSRWDRQRSEPGPGQWVRNGQCGQRSFKQRRADSQRQQRGTQQHQQRIVWKHREITRRHAGHNTTAAPSSTPVTSTRTRDSDVPATGKRKPGTTRSRKAPP